VPLEEAIEVAHQHSNAFVWIGLNAPEPEEFDDVARRFDLHPLAVEDAVHARQRPKLEVYGDTVFLVVGAARYVDHDEVVDLSQFLIFVGEGFLITVRHGESTLLAEVRRDIVNAPDELKCGPIGVVHAIVDRVVDGYGDVLRQLYVDVGEVEQQVFSPARGNVAERIYKLKREVLEFRQAVVPLAEPMERLVTREVPHSGGVPVEYVRDVHDHVLRASDRLEALDALLTGVLTANQAEVAVRQNEDMRKISAWVAIIALPTMIAGIYGMNFDHMPELRWLYGYPFALALMAVGSTVLYVLFRRRNWL
jgi:magnesium transporter